MLDPAREILQNVYLDLVNNPKKYKSQRTYVTTDHDRKVDQIKEDYKNKTGKKLGRNDLCPCGSGKKFKNCCEKEIN